MFLGTPWPVRGAATGSSWDIVDHGKAITSSGDLINLARFGWDLVGSSWDLIKCDQDLIESSWILATFGKDPTYRKVKMTNGRKWWSLTMVINQINWSLNLLQWPTTRPVVVEFSWQRHAINRYLGWIDQTLVQTPSNHMILSSSSHDWTQLEINELKFSLSSL